jgi:hypothetical protein
MSLGELERGDDWKSRAYYKVLSWVSGQELAETERQKLRKHRKKLLEKNQDVNFISQSHMDVLIDMGLKEAQLMDDFEPDLLIVTERQYKQLFDIPAGIGIGKHYEPMMGEIDYEPPKTFQADYGPIEVTYSNASRGMLLVESNEL